MVTHRVFGTLIVQSKALKLIEKKKGGKSKKKGIRLIL